MKKFVIRVLITMGLVIGVLVKEGLVTSELAIARNLCSQIRDLNLKKEDFIRECF